MKAVELSISADLITLFQNKKGTVFLLAVNRLFL